MEKRLKWKNRCDYSAYSAEWHTFDLTTGKNETEDLSVFSFQAHIINILLRRKTAKLGRKYCKFHTDARTRFLVISV